jgi:hypothetical protein
MLLDQVFDHFDHVKWVFVRKDGKMKKVRRAVSYQKDDTAGKKPMFPISKERK